MPDYFLAIFLSDFVTFTQRESDRGLHTVTLVLRANSLRGSIGFQLFGMQRSTDRNNIFPNWRELFSTYTCTKSSLSSTQQLLLAQLLV